MKRKLANEKYAIEVILKDGTKITIAHANNYALELDCFICESENESMVIMRDAINYYRVKKV